MTEQGATGRIAIIGMGPRGLGALEALATRLHARPMPVQSVQPIQVDIFDPFTAPGAGPNFEDEHPISSFSSCAERSWKNFHKHKCAAVNTSLCMCERLHAAYDGDCEPGIALLYT